MLARGVLSGLIGTAVMTATMRLERALLPRTDGPVDYDASGHVVIAASTLLPRPPRTDGERTAIFLGVHWGYGSAVAVAHRLLRERLSRPVAACVFYALCQGMAFTLFPLLGGTPPPWRWRRAILFSSLAQHAVYVAAVDVTEELTGRTTSRRG